MSGAISWAIDVVHLRLVVLNFPRDIWEAVVGNLVAFLSKNPTLMCRE
jgi:hypothetical protein